MTDPQAIRYERSEAMKARRRLVGDNGGIRFQGKIAAPRTDGICNTITCIAKDNYIIEFYD